MTPADEVAEALMEVEGACPCRSEVYYCNSSMPARLGCSCVAANGTLSPCSWPGHAAIARYGDLCVKLGRATAPLPDSIQEALNMGDGTYKP